MSSIALLSLVKGFVHDIQKVQSLSDEPVNARLLSDRSLYILQNLSSLDITFRTRYGQLLTGDEYIPVREGTPEDEAVSTAIDLIRRDLTDMSIETLLQCICDQTAAMVAAISNLGSVMASNQCGCNVGQGEDTPEAQEGGPVPPPIGDIVFQEPVAEPDRKCKAANLVHFTLRDLIAELDRLNVDDYGTLGIAIMVSIIVAAIGSVVATPMVGLLLAVAGGVAVLAARLAGVTVDLAGIVAAMDANQGDLVCALYNATTTTNARNDYLLVLDGPLNSIQLGIVELLMYNAVLDVLFFDTQESATFWSSYTPVVDCSACASVATLEIIPTSAAGEIIGPNRFEIGDTVRVRTTDDILCPGRQRAAFELLRNGVQESCGWVITDLTGWSETCAFPCGDNDCTFWNVGFGPPIHVFPCNTPPDNAPRSGTAIFKVESGTVCEFDITRQS